MAGQDPEGRAKISAEVYAPTEGWDAAEANLFRSIMMAGGEEED